MYVKTRHISYNIWDLITNKKNYSPRKIASILKYTNHVSHHIWHFHWFTSLNFTPADHFYSKRVRVSIYKAIITESLSSCLDYSSFRASEGSRDNENLLFDNGRGPNKVSLAGDFYRACGRDTHIHTTHAPQIFRVRWKLKEIGGAPTVMKLLARFPV